jgi:hypothetical protein
MAQDVIAIAMHNKHATIEQLLKNCAAEAQQQFSTQLVAVRSS